MNPSSGRVPQYGQAISSMAARQCATAAAAASSIRWPSRKRSMVKGALIGCGSSRAMVQANTCAEPGVALKPPVPQTQFAYKPFTAALGVVGGGYGVTP